jgi:uncharacterized protein YaeQ
MSAKFSFNLASKDRRRELPGKIIIGLQENETIAHVVLKLMAYILFFRERLQIEANLHQDSIPFVPDLVQLDYELRPKLWIECGEPGVNKLNKLAVKAPDAEIWIVTRSEASARHLVEAMARAELRENRYQLVGLDAEMFEEMCGMVQGRNEITWVNGEFDPPNMQFDFNGLWFDAPFVVLRY